MPLIPLLRAGLSFVGMLLLILAIYLLWTWWLGEPFADETGVGRVREDWRLWTALALLAWSVLGRYPALLLLARRDTDPTRAVRSPGETIDSPTGARLYVETQGFDEGPVVIATHGWGLDSTIWHYLKGHLAAERVLVPHQLVTWDLAGQGRSRLPSHGQVRLPDFACDLAYLVERASPRPVILIGHSIGGMTMQTLARDRPDLFGGPIVGVVLLNTTFTNPLRTMILSDLATSLQRPLLEPIFKLVIAMRPLAWLGAWQGYLNGTAHIANRVQFGKLVTRSQLEHATLLGTRNPPDNLAKGNLAMFNWDATGALSDVVCPVMIVGGEMDIVTKLEASEVIYRSGSTTSLERVSDVNHLGFLERAQHYNTLISAFVAERSRVSARPAQSVDLRTD